MAKTAALLLVLGSPFLMSSAVLPDGRRCMDVFNNDQGGLDHRRFAGFWYALHTYRVAYPLINAQTEYTFLPGSINTWQVTTGFGLMDNFCLRDQFNISVRETGSRLFRHPRYYHHVIDTDYDNYAVVLFCSRIGLGGRCDLFGIQTVILSRNKAEMRSPDVWSKVKVAASLCADLDFLTDVEQEQMCVCQDEEFTMFEECESTQQ